MEQQPDSNKKIKKYVVSLLSAITFLIVLNWLFHVSFVNVTIAGSSSGEQYTVTITDQSGEPEFSFQTSETTIKKRVKRGSYVVSVQQSNHSFLTTINAPGYFRSAKVDAKLVQEKSRRFVGDNPANCMYFVGGVLYSSECTGQFADINKHVPASSQQSTYVLKVNENSGIAGYVQGTTDAGGKTIALVKTPQDSEGGGSYSLVQFSSGLSSSRQILAENLNTDADYSIAAYKNGFLIYSQSLDTASYYSSYGAPAQSVDLGEVNDKDLAPKFLSSWGNDILTGYTSPDDENASNDKTELVIGSQHYTFKRQFTSASQCAVNTLCAIDATGLSVYYIDGGDSDLLYMIPGAAGVYNSAGKTLVVNRNGVINLNVSNGSGYYDYSFGEYKFNNFVVVPNGYLVSVTGPKNKNSALFIDSVRSDFNSVDKRVLTLAKLNEVETVSIYDKYIYIVPDLGEQVYNNSSNEFEYDPTVKAASNTKINQAILKSGIDTKQYRVINTAR